VHEEQDDDDALKLAMASAMIGLKTPRLMAAAKTVSAVHASSVAKTTAYWAGETM